MMDFNIKSPDEGKKDEALLLAGKLRVLRLMQIMSILVILLNEFLQNLAKTLHLPCSSQY